MKKCFLITYKQRFMGEVLEDSYIKYVRNIKEIHQAVDDLYSDPHVFSVNYKELVDDE